MLVFSCSRLVLKAQISRDSLFISLLAGNSALETGSRQLPPQPRSPGDPAMSDLREKQLVISSDAAYTSRRTT
jgi:hypothetical protein